MPKLAKVLGPLAVRNLKTPGLHFVGEVAGLALQVSPTTARTWILRIKIGDKRRDMGLGAFPEVSLADARDMARKARQRVREGHDPIEERRALREALKLPRAKGMTFEKASLAYIAGKAPEWKNEKHAAQWESTLRKYAFPAVGELSVADIELPQVLEVLEPIWRDKPETASRLRGRMEAVLDWATTRGHREGLNPARWRGHLDNQLPKTGKLKSAKHHRTGSDGHHAAMAIDDAPVFLTRLQEAEGMGARALEFAILTAARSGEVRGATWAEFDLTKGLWTIPGARMKAGKEHRVPLSKSALALLEGLPCMGDTEIVFWAPRGGKLSDMTLSAVMRRMEAGATPHGFRSTFRDWVSERTSYPGDMAEMALAHTIGDKVEAAYRRGDQFEKRRRMMQDWADYLAKPQGEGKVVPIGAGRA